MRYVTLAESLAIHDRILTQSGGLAGILSLGALESALAQPFATFGGQALDPALVDKAAALGFSMLNNHPFVDGNKRTGHAVMEMYLMLNGYGIEATMDEQVDVIVQVAAGERDRKQFVEWLRIHVVVAD